MAPERANGNPLLDILVVLIIISMLMVLFKNTDEDNKGVRVESCDAWSTTEYCCTQERKRFYSITDKYKFKDCVDDCMHDE